ncbi:4-hydroxythreonine-4-phosphate dehydrogenase PdxA [Emcibacter sp.]|uniref:4-hydroxythreonine-4-phosphate dehydrogenase PdxA n=1 Tax=Emcibacter sp. TaxID=1979954 RepID=UPI002AA5ECF1|nr:4-hydroxythreonine-4-phosphate dehydrogenase PdxA [Emcibacter sp.]
MKPLAVSIGEPAGIGPEIIGKAWTSRHKEKLPPFFVLGSVALLKQLLPDIAMEKIVRPEDCDNIFPAALPVLDIPAVGDVTPGKPIEDTAAMVIRALDMAAELFFGGRISGLVTAPIQKSVLYQAGFDCPGHTEYLAQLCANHTGAPQTAVMMLACDELRVVPLTIHVPLANVPALITEELLEETCRKINSALQADFGLSQPRIAVAGLNPHAGEDGGLGREEIDIIAPAIKTLQDEGLNVFGPLAADTMFHDLARTTYDVALCMYHDQALIPIKTLDFDGGVNVTLGLPLIRTSPDHGTALNIAGQGKANPKSLIKAIQMAHEMSLQRGLK